jgi:hypothetical protein
MYTILLFLGILILLCFFNKEEGFENSSIGKYDYLAPVPKTNTWKSDTINQFVTKYNAINTGIGGDFVLNTNTFETQGMSKLILENTLEEEGIYYISNGKFPINLYVSDYLTANPSNIPDTKQGSITINNKNISQIYPNRLVYMNFIATKESLLKPPPESYEIYMGTNPSPNTASSSSLPTSSTSSSSLPTSSTSSTSLSPSDIDTLKSICSKY